MKMYSKTGKVWSHDYEFKYIYKLEHADIKEDNVAYYHHPYDDLMHGVPLFEALDSKQWQHLKTMPNVKLYHENCSETFDISFCKDVEKTIVDNDIDSTKLVIIVMDENHKNFLADYLTICNVTLPVIEVNNYLLKEISIPEVAKKPGRYKFSSLSRNYRDWRLCLYASILDENLLDDFNYSFFNIWPYDDGKTVYSPRTMLQDLANIGYDIKNPKKLKRWLKSCPHELGSSNNVFNKWSNITYDAIQSAGIHIIIETHYDQKAFVTDKKYDRKFAPSSITEKAYKPIACQRPFIAFSTPYWLKDLKKLGFKTFDGIINEEYDNEEDNAKRLNMIVAEIKRISNLSDSEYYNILEKCREITDYNYKKLIEKQNA